jgi:hypothetical protein
MCCEYLRIDGASYVMSRQRTSEVYFALCVAADLRLPLHRCDLSEVSYVESYDLERVFMRLQLAPSLFIVQNGHCNTEAALKISRFWRSSTKGWKSFS